MTTFGFTIGRARLETITVRRERLDAVRRHLVLSRGDTRPCAPGAAGATDGFIAHLNGLEVDSSLIDGVRLNEEGRAIDG